MKEAIRSEAAGEGKAMATGDHEIVRLLSALGRNDTDVLQILSTLGGDPEIMKVASLFVGSTRSAAVKVAPVLARSQQMAASDTAAINGFGTLKNGRGDVRQTLIWLRNDTEMLHELSLAAKRVPKPPQGQSDTDVLQDREQSDTDVLQDREQSDTDVLQDRGQSDTDILQNRGQSDTDVLQMQMRQERYVLEALAVLGRGNPEFLQQRLPESAEPPAALPLLCDFADKNQELLSLLAAFVAFQAALANLKNHALFSAMEKLAQARPSTVLALARLAQRDFESLTALVSLV